MLPTIHCIGICSHHNYRETKNQLANLKAGVAVSSEQSRLLKAQADAANINHIIGGAADQVGNLGGGGGGGGGGHGGGQAGGGGNGGGQAGGGGASAGAQN